MATNLLHDVRIIRTYAEVSLEDIARNVPPFAHRLGRKRLSAAAVCRYERGSRNILAPGGLAVLATIVERGCDLFSIAFDVPLALDAKVLIPHVRRLAQLCRKHAQMCQKNIASETRKLEQARARIAGYIAAAGV
jgi:hypothetical protein